MAALDESVRLTPGRTASRATDQPRPRQGSPLRRFWPQYLAVSPFYLLFLVFGLFPIGYSVFLSFQDWDGIGPMRFVGLAQYQFLLSDPRFWNAVGNTFVIWLISTIPMLFLALVLAFLLHQNIRFKGFLRVAYFLPNVTSMVAMAIVFGSIFSDSFGIVNSALAGLGIDQVPWLSSNWGIKVTIAVMVIWRFTGYNAIIYLAGLQAIPTDLYDAAKVDGANGWRIFRSVTVPMLRPVILFTVITSTIGGLSLFTEPQVLLGDTGGVGEAGMTIVLYQYNQAFTKFDFGYGSAIAWALFVIAAVFAIINWRLIRERDGIRGGRKKGASA
ncbi:binding-protein-dependent transport systems inner membrane component [Beutenbergia cavernae DSM 12333]|uniref:Binding-protein-dependent transport systems inner membrane component n=1 Tax=Beutenbergia cavernae (strain ATCC BAA-8 / DSM 12333 / CCUG 43141 / JCM 11478 / NBRC 16432 / NCIMB 13614 / HKI 0122) TaxID=471853 RepID=C5BXS4_BEUC1|nr:sugar ABC transporter permease [Beutenbergia cavernae]ACQ78818.1 binding-protein-dependent transport systems inner membrane component [Beutenbergia cavernae DSM 12333]